MKVYAIYYLYDRETWTYRKHHIAFCEDEGGISVELKEKRYYTEFDKLPEYIEK